MDLRKSRVKEEDDNGNVYQGDKLDGMKHGYGIYTQPDGLVYEGYFASDMQEG